MIPDSNFKVQILEEAIVVSEQARRSVAARILAHPNGGADVIDALGLGDLA